MKLHRSSGHLTLALALLALPFIISRGALALAHSKKTGGNMGIRSGQPAASRSNAAKGRVRLK